MANPNKPGDQIAPADEAAAAAKTSELKVAPGLSVTTKRGIVSEGETVSARDFVHGKTDVEDLLARGALVKS
jgi:hypothetical protein